MGIRVTDNRKGIALIILNHMRRMRGVLWSENANSTTFSWRLPRQSCFNSSVRTPEVNTGAQSWKLTPGRFIFRGWPQGEVSDCVPREGALCFFPLHSLLSIPSPQFMCLRLITAHGTNSQSSHVAMFVPQVTGVELLCTVLVNTILNFLNHATI